MKKIEVYYNGTWESAILRKIGEDNKVFAAMEKDKTYRIFSSWRYPVNGNHIHQH